MAEVLNSVPDGWEVKALGEVLSLEYGKPLTKEKRKEDGTFPVYGANGIKARSDEYYHDLASIVVGRKGSAGEINLTDGPFWPLDVTYFVKFDSSKFNLIFLFHLLTSLNLPSLAKGVKPGINRNEVYALRALFPHLPEQERIVGVLDEAFEGIATATAQAEKNLQNARELFQSVLQSTFFQKGGTQSTDQEKQIKLSLKEGHKKTDSTTRGRAASERLIQGDLSLSVGMPNSPTKTGWHWIKLTDIAKLESGHTPSRRHPEYWGGEIPWVGIKDAKLNHGGIIYETNQYTNGLGINNSSARILPKLTVCLSRTASVGYVFIMGVEMATSQDFVNWICSDGIIPAFLKYLLIAEGKGLSKYSSGAVHQTIYYPEVKAFHVCIPDLKKQQSIVEKLGSLSEETKRLEAIYQRKLDALAELKQSLLQRAFTGQL